MEYLLSTIFILAEEYAAILCCDAFLERKQYGKNFFIAFFVKTVTVFVFVNAFADSNLIIKSAVLIAFRVIQLQYVYSGTLLIKILLASITQAIFGVMDVASFFVAAYLLNTTVDEIRMSYVGFTVVVIIARLTMILAMFIVNKMRPFSKSTKYNKPCLVAAVIFSVSAIITEATLFDISIKTNYTSSLFMINAIGMIVTNIAILMLIDWIEKSARVKEENAVLNERIAVQMESVSALQDAYAQQRKITHDFNNHIETISQLVNEHEYAQTEQYLKELSKSSSNRVLPVNSHHPIIDALLNQKYSYAQKNNIDVVFSINDLSGIKIKNEDIVIVLANLLDNAIEACLKLQANKKIQVILLLEDELLLSVRNTSNAVNISNNNILTTKGNYSEHGYGLQNVKMTLGKYKAEYVLNYENGWFQFTAEMPNR